MKDLTPILLLVASGVFMSTLDSSMLNVALPSIMEEFHSPLALTEWVVMIYLLSITVMLLFWGHLSKKYNQGKIYRLGVFVFSVGSLLCSLAPDIYLLIFFRFIQAQGASMMMAMGPAIIKAIFPRNQLGKGLGQIGIATSLGLMSGPPISGLLIRWADWRLIFLITVPVGFAVFFLSRITLQKASPEPLKTDQQHRYPFDTTGGILWVAAVSLTLFLTTHVTSICCADQNNYTSLIVILLSVPASWFLLIRHEKKQTNPLLPLALFKQRFFSMAMLSAMLSFCVLFFVLLLTPFFLRSVQQLSADQTGYIMMALPFCVFFVSPVAGKLHDRYGAQSIATSGLAFCFLALLGFTTINASTSPWIIATFLALLGLGQAMFLSPNSAAALNGVTREQAGLTSSLLATARNMGMLAGTAMAGLIFTLYFSRLTGGLDMKDFIPELTPDFMLAMRRSFQVATFLAGVGMAASWYRKAKH